MRQHYDLGKFLRHRYSGFLNETYLRHEVSYVEPPSPPPPQYTTTFSDTPPPPSQIHHHFLSYTTTFSDTPPPSLRNTTTTPLSDTPPALSDTPPPPLETVPRGPSGLAGSGLWFMFRWFPTSRCADVKPDQTRPD